MADFGEDSAVSGGDGRYDATLSPSWEIWGPQGGYVAAVALRAAGCESPHPLPASFVCHFLRPARFGGAEIRVESLRHGRRAGSLRAIVVQGDDAVLEALVWTVSEMAGIDHDSAPEPEVPPPDYVEPWDEYLPGGEPPFPFWRNFDVRPHVPHPATWGGPAAEPRLLGWSRLVQPARLDDPFVDAGRLLMAADSFMYPSATLAHDGPFPYVAPSLDLAMSFHAPGTGTEWLLIEAQAPLSRGALVAGTARVWSEDGRLLGTAMQQMLQQT